MLTELSSRFKRDQPTLFKKGLPQLLLPRLWLMGMQRDVPVVHF